MIAVDEAVIAMLDSGNHELVFASCGVLMNLMVDDEKRPKLLQHGGVSKYVQVLLILISLFSLYCGNLVLLFESTKGTTSLPSAVSCELMNLTKDEDSVHFSLVIATALSSV